MGMDDQNGEFREKGGFGSRFIVAIVMALVGIIMYMSQVEVNPITGEKQHVALSPSEEIRLGLESAPEMAHQMGGELPDTDPRTQLVRRIGNFIVDKTDAKKSPWKFKFHVLADSQTVNAFALPGGQIFITWGLLKKLETEAQLAGVLSHEMGHVIERHSAQQMAKNQLGGLLVTAVATGASDQQNSSNHALVIASVANQMIQLRYGRKDESQADIWGLKLMSQVGFNPQAMIAVMQILKAQDHGSGTLEIFQTHPNPDLRIKQIAAYLQAHPPAANLSDGKRLHFESN